MNTIYNPKIWNLFDNYYKNRSIDSYISNYHEHYPWEPSSVFLINLDHRKDRLENSKKELYENGISFKRISAFPASVLNNHFINDYLDTEHACKLSHIKALMEANKLNKHSVIMEDDIVFVPDFKKKITNYFSLLNNNNDWDIFFPYCDYPPTAETDRLFYKATYCLHFYIINKKSISKLINMMMSSEEPADYVTVKNVKAGKLKCYCSSENLVYQLTTFKSDIKDRSKQVFKLRTDTVFNKQILIPKIFHHIWLTDEKIKDPDLRLSFMKHNPDWSFYMWTKYNLKNANIPDNIKNMGTNEAIPYVVRGDCLRFAFLYYYGGIYADMDMLCCKPLDVFLNTTSFTCESYKGQMSNTLMGSITKNPLMYEIMKSVAGRIDKNLKACIKNPHIFSGVVFQTPMLKRFETIYPAYYFQPFSWENLEGRNKEWPESYAVHYWHGMDADGWSHNYGAFK